MAKRGRRPRIRRWLAAGTAAAVAFSVLSLVRADAQATLSSPSADAVVAAYQRAFLDPQAADAQIAGPTASGGVLQGTSASAVTLPASVGGSWDYLDPFPTSFNAIHAIEGPNGKILLVAGSGLSQANFKAGTFTSYIWDPATNERRMIPTPADMFCSGHVLLPDGRALVGGGTTGYAPFKGSNALYAFNFYNETYQKLTPLEVARWYPATVTGADGHVLFISGFDANGTKTSTVESFDYRTNTHVMLASTKSLPLYPRVHLASNGKFFIAEPTATGFWDPYANTFKAVGGVAMPKVSAYNYASCFVGDVRDQNLMVMGGGFPATKVSTLIKLNAATPTKVAGPSLLAAKAYVSCVNLPDGNLLEANGGTKNDASGASTEAAILPSASGNWTPVNSLPSGEHRLYHSMLFLMDDGRIISMSSNPTTGSRSHSVLVYSPPYLFKGTRPVITKAPTEVAYGGTYPVGATTSGATLTRFTLTTPVSDTHSMDNNQRYLSLPVVNGAITMPAQSAILPPGWYRLWAVDSKGSVSRAHWIHMGDPSQAQSANSAMACCCC
jgi:hypothetical protein